MRARPLLVVFCAACGSGAQEGESPPPPPASAAPDPRGADGVWSMDECKRENAGITLECSTVGALQWITAGPKLGCQGVSSASGGRFTLDVDASGAVVGMRVEVNPDDPATIETIRFEAPARLPLSELTITAPITWKTTLRPSPIVQRFGKFGFIEARFDVGALQLSGPATANDFGAVVARGRFTSSRARVERFDTKTEKSYFVDEPEASVEGCFHLITKVEPR